jgi:hypothetical protein
MKSRPGRLFTYDDFADLSPTAVAPALSRLKADGRIRRARKGVYYVPRATPLGEVPADSAAVGVKVAGRTAAPSGLSAASALGLTTQVPAHPELAVENRRPTPPPGISFRPRIGTNRSGLSPHEIAVFEVLRDLDGLADISAPRIEEKLVRVFKRRETRSRLLRAALAEPPRVRAMVGALAEAAGADPKELRRLRRTLNPTTRFHFGPLAALPEAPGWGARGRAA